MKIGILKPKIKLIAYLRGKRMGPEELVAFGAHATLKKEGPETLYLKALKEGNTDKLINRILDVTLSSGHLSVLDQAVYTFSIRDVPRLATLYLVQPLYLSHLQQSMRRVEPYGLYIPRFIKKYEDILFKSIDLYYKMVSNGVPKEDARYVIPLYTVTNILTCGNARELTHLSLMTRSEYTPDIIRKIVDDMIIKASKKSPNLFKDWGENYNILRYYPAPNIFRRPGDEIDKFIVYLRDLSGGSPTYLYSYSEAYKPSNEEVIKAIKDQNQAILTLLRNNNYNIITRMSLSAFHQAIRQRTWNHIPESIYNALNRLDYIIPYTIRRSKYIDDYRDMVLRLHRLYHKLIKEGVRMTEAIGVVSHAHVIYDLINIDGWNLISSLPIRRCIKAQWEIRYIAGDIAKAVGRVNRLLAIYTLPNCMTLGACPEKYPCEYVDKFVNVGPLIK